MTVQPGDVLCDRYRVDRVLGAGGMGVVVLAEHIELRERVAIKFLLDLAADDVELSERFLREARAAVKIRSEHVVRVSDVGRLPSGAPYLVMEYLEGEDLSQRLERGRVPIEDAVDYIIQCCEAMHVAHRAGIVHRDLKPANLFLSQRPDGSPILKVLDFGISKVGGAEAAQLSLTRTQAMMGSPLYMSPEQMRSSKDVAPSTDIWSLGVILHELISGEVPFSGASVTEVLVKVMQDAPPPLRALRPEVPEALEAAVLRCLAKSPRERYPSVSALAVAITPFASGHTLGLQRRLRASLSDPPPAPATADKRLAATRVETDAASPAAVRGNEGASPTPLHVLAPKTAASALPASALPASALPASALPSPTATRIEVAPPGFLPAAAPLAATPAQTNTDWEGSSTSPRAASRGRGRLPIIAGAVGIALLGAFFLARLRESTAPHQEGPLAPSAALPPATGELTPTTAHGGATAPAPTPAAGELTPATAHGGPSLAPPAARDSAAAPGLAPDRSELTPARAHGGASARAHSDPASADAPTARPNVTAGAPPPARAAATPASLSAPSVPPPRTAVSPRAVSFSSRPTRSTQRAPAAPAPTAAPPPTATPTPASAEAATTPPPRARPKSLSIDFK